MRADRLRKWEVRGRVRSVEREEGAELIAEKGENEAILETLSRCSTLTLIYIYIYINNDFFFFLIRIRPVFYYFFLTQNVT